ncbi:Hypothetical_protein [Hexamita inflata]|uniref:Hypothetical_protein n=1 Tax=Hexamita inflata TaxID=28002 RepID=A0ABP1JYV9_9EUKA
MKFGILCSKYEFCWIIFNDQIQSKQILSVIPLYKIVIQPHEFGYHVQSFILVLQELLISVKFYPSFFISRIVVMLQLNKAHQNHSCFLISGFFFCLKSGFTSFFLYRILFRICELSVCVCCVIFGAAWRKASDILDSSHFAFGFSFSCPSVGVSLICSQLKSKQSRSLNSKPPNSFSSSKQVIIERNIVHHCYRINSIFFNLITGYSDMVFRDYQSYDQYLTIDCQFFSMFNKARFNVNEYSQWVFMVRTIKQFNAYNLWIFNNYKLLQLFDLESLLLNYNTENQHNIIKIKYHQHNITIVGQHMNSRIWNCCEYLCLYILHTCQIFKVYHSISQIYFTYQKKHVGFKLIHSNYIFQLTSLST